MAPKEYRARRGAPRRAETRVSFGTRRRLWKAVGMTGTQDESHSWLKPRSTRREAGWGGGAQLKLSRGFWPVRFLRHR